MHTDNVPAAALVFLTASGQKNLDRRGAVVCCASSQPCFYIGEVDRVGDGIA